MSDQLALLDAEETFTDLMRRLAAEVSQTRPFRVLLTGSRTWADHNTLWRVLEEIHAQRPDMVVVHGACYPREDDDGDRPDMSADWLAHVWCTAWNIPDEPHPADWDAPCRSGCSHGYKVRADQRPYCPAVGNYRNQDMVDLGADLCAAFQVGSSTGTADCMRRARRAGIPTKRFPS
jgi:hypothetical protein